MTRRLRTAPQARALFIAKGITITDFAHELGVHKQTVWEVLSGRIKCTHGDAHRVAVVLGMKRGEILPAGASAVKALTPRSARRGA